MHRLISALSLLAFISVASDSGVAQEATDLDWNHIPHLSMGGDLRFFWNVADGSKGDTARNAQARGFGPVTLVGTYADYPGGQRENISTTIGAGYDNPWGKPPFFERIVRRNIDLTPPNGIYVHDIELPFEEDAQRAWQKPAVRSASGITSQGDFEEAYFRKWAEWFWLPLQWTKERYRGVRVGLYGPQPFRRDFWGIAGKNAEQIDGTHKSDWRLWKYIDQYVDFYIASIYVFYDNPDSVFYMAANIEENYLRTLRMGDRPLYAYTWLRFHNSNEKLEGKELPSWLVEAMAIVPYFSGAKGVVLWGWEPQLKTGMQLPYQQLPQFVRSLRRVSALSEKISRGRLLIDRPAQTLWKAHQPLIRTVVIGKNECVIMAIDPWQQDNARMTHSVRCGEINAPIVIEGRQTTLALLNKQGLQTY
ncbi:MULTISPECIES: hypothetical protein [unclassified Mesorhizobium]|uniref:hypothetical protein n=1 Tax=unclassified Mesorhizobium TaxID=325217 RepID=UPI000FD468D5|nr:MULTISPECIES: hypothetical protein [unclassified Mesorhizobium]RVB80566.1 hypothetical protein EN885_01345 [Mesorhizobium sp. M6A.T.Cr.TU.014.01.1.1]RWP97575.1 MAG: hypothetical protein EOR91_29560 [Mesorhizobium sp.]RWQ10848.1 MAG: hypothetical protein EOR90_03585 [Mesorhizobium sp.]